MPRRHEVSTIGFVLSFFAAAICRASDPGDQAEWVAYRHDAKALYSAEGHLRSNGTIAFDKRPCDIDICDPQSGAKTSTLATLGSRISQIAISADDKNLLCATHYDGVQLIDISSGKATKVNSHSGKVFSIAYASDGAWACGFGDGTIEFHDSKNNTSSWLATSAKDHPVVALAFLKRNGAQELASGSDNRDEPAVQFWDLSKNGSADGSLQTNHTRVLSIAVNSDGTRLATGGPAGEVDLFDVASQRILWTKKGASGENQVFGLAFQRNDQRVACAPAGAAPAISFMTVENGDGSVVATVNGHTGGNRSISFTDSTIASGGDDGASVSVAKLP